MVSRKTSIELLTPPSSVPRPPRTQAPNDHAHDTSYTSLHCPSKAAPPSPSASTSPPIPSRTSHPSYPDVPGPARPSSSFTNHERLHHQQLKVPSYQTNKSTTKSFSPAISSSPPHTDLVSSGVGTLLVSSALHPISSTMLFFSAVIPRKLASFQSLTSLKYAGCGPSRLSWVRVRV